jgi:lysozyme
LNTLTKNIIAELIYHEAIVQEAYKDSKGIWTWSVGITDASGIRVTDYVDKPQSLVVCISAFKGLLNDKYLPQVLKAFKNTDLTETQLAAALSFHYNTGSIGTCSWVLKFLKGDIEGAKAAFMLWRNPPEVLYRRQAECDLFFKGVWSNKGKVTVYPVKKPSYKPDFNKGRLVSIEEALDEEIN